tara:strand:- start:5295 stop:6647 length:1353 start_codon:yes stop_codon:yes gene_type:complete
MTGHARLGPSNHRWPNCPGSVREEANYPDIAGEAAIDGTGSHLLLEMCMDNNVPAIQYDQQIIGANHPDHTSGWLVGIERTQRVQMCLDYITRRVNELKAQYPDGTVTVEAESKSDIGGMFGRDDWWGTCDVAITCKQDHTGEVFFIEVVDYKDGRGWVNAKDNTQLISYLGGKIRPYITGDRVKNCRMTIVQPKTNPVIRYQCSTRPEDKLSVESVMNKIVDMSRAAAETDKPDAPTRSGKHCQWCKANPKRGGHCVTATEQSIQVVTDMSTNVAIPTLPMFEQITQVIADPKSLTSDQLSELLSAQDALMAAFDACRTEIQVRIEAGEHVSGYAMQAGNSSRKWNEPEEEIVKKLKSRRLKLDDIYPKKLISPAAAMKLTKLTDVQKKKIEADLITEVAGKLTLKKVAHSVAQSSTNDVDSVQQMFADVPASTEKQTPAPVADEPSFF